MPRLVSPLARLLALFATVALLAACRGGGDAPPRDLGREALSVYIDRKLAGEAPGRTAPYFAVRGAVSTEPVLLFEPVDPRAFGTLTHASVAIARVRTRLGRDLEERFSYEEIGARGATLRPGVSFNLARPGLATLRIVGVDGQHTDRHFFYPGDTYEVTITLFGSKGLATQSVRFIVS